MVSTRNRSSKSKKKKKLDTSIISHNASCVDADIDLPSNLMCFFVRIRKSTKLMDVSANPKIPTLEQRVNNEM